MIEVSHAALRRLLFWSAVGIEGAKGGQYEEVPVVIEYLAGKIGMKKYQFPKGKFPVFKK